MKISLLIPVWKRFKNINEILKIWLLQVDEIIIWDNSGTFKSNLPIKLINSNYNFGGQIKFKITNLFKNNLVLICDDDIIPGKNLVYDLEKWFIKLGENCILSIFGRKFEKGNCEKYRSYRSYSPFLGNVIKRPIKVDFIGRLYFGQRKNFLVDMTDTNDTRLDDLNWICALRKIKPLVKLFVIPTNEFQNTDEANDNNSTYHQKGYWEVRDKFVYNNFEILCQGD